MIVLLLACSSDEAAWAVHHGSVIPSATGLSGTQTWEFFPQAWADGRDAELVCARAQEVTGTVVAPPEGCTGCDVAYEVSVAELDTDCAGALADEATYAAVFVTFGIGDVPADFEALDPYPGRTLGWYASFDGETAEPYGFAYDEALDWQGERGAPGWVADQIYTLWPAYAWDLR